MKTIFLLRHAQALLYSSNNSDINRSINDDGKREAEFVGELLLKKNEFPQLIISSPALRAFTTAIIVAQKINYPEKEILINKNIYEASSKKLKVIIHKTDPKIESLMLVGHNPGISDFIYEISEIDFDFLPTAGLVCLKNDIQSWDDIEGKWILKYNYNPRN